MSRLFSNHSATVSRFPRVSGDEPRLDRPSVSLLQFSPRERG